LALTLLNVRRADSPAPALELRTRNTKNEETLNETRNLFDFLKN
jgi:hypothetical protein